jgi:Tol biopolymer transport system component/DNA-binding winged helix-turn-helix (wHTH) protein
MRETDESGSIYRFGSFELNPQDGELRKRGIRVKLQEQPLQILLLLLEHSGQLVIREHIQNRLWPSGTYVDYENAINSAVRKLRGALGDLSESPRFIETLPRRGYRFLGKVEKLPRTLADPSQEEIISDRSGRKRINATAVAGGSVLIIAAAMFWLARRPEHYAAQLSPRPLTAAEGWETSASFSPHGDQVVYAWDEGRGSNQHLYVKMVGPGRPVRLTAGTGSDFFPTWSPDGRNIAFVRGLNHATAIYLIPPLGGSERKLTDGCFSGTISWSPDGKSLVAAVNNSFKNPTSLYLVSAENGDKIRLTTPPDARTSDQHPAFSPDGHSLLFTRCGGPFQCGLYVLDLTPDYRPKGRPRMLRQESGDISGVAWTADGKDAIYSLSGDAAYNYQLVRVRVRAGAQPVPLTFAGEHVNAPAIALQGNRLAYVQSFLDADIWQIQPGKAPHPFTSSTREEDSPQFSPDGTRVAFSSSRSGLMQIWICDADGKNTVQLTHFEAGPSGTPRWSPDGRWIAFDRQAEEGWRIFVMAADGGQVRRLTRDNGADEVIPSWSGDGKSLYYACNRTGRFEIWKASMQGRNCTQLTHNGGFVAFESRDGRSIYYTNNIHDGNSILWILPNTGGKERTVLKSVAGRSFAVMQDGIYYLAQVSEAGGSINFHRFSTGKDEELATFKERAYAMGLTVSPDRKTILLPVFVRMGSDVMVAENFR